MWRHCQVTWRTLAQKLRHWEVIRLHHLLWSNWTFSLGQFHRGEVFAWRDFNQVLIWLFYPCRIKCIWWTRVTWSQHQQARRVCKEKQSICECCCCTEAFKNPAAEKIPRFHQKFVSDLWPLTAYTPVHQVYIITIKNNPFEIFFRGMSRWAERHESQHQDDSVAFSQSDAVTTVVLWREETSARWRTAPADNFHWQLGIWHLIRFGHFFFFSSRCRCREVSPISQCLG